MARRQIGVLGSMAWLAISGASAGCLGFSPTYPVGITCGEQGECPPDQTCHEPGHTCRPDDVDAAVPAMGVPLVQLSPIGEVSGCAEIEYTLTDPASRPVNVVFMFQDRAGTVRLAQAPSPPGESGTLRLASSPTGVVHRFHWNTTPLITETGAPSGVVYMFATISGDQTLVFHAPATVRIAPACDRDLGGLRSSASVTSDDTHSPEGGYAIGDFNADGKLDVASGMTDDTQLFFGLGNGEFEPGPHLGLEPTILATVDIDGDGDDDIVSSFGTLSVAVQNPASVDGFEPVRVIDAAAAVAPVAFGDIDHDGHIDLAVSTENGIETLRGSPDHPGTFEDPVPVPGARRLSSVALTDLDGDGILDLLTANEISFGIFHQDPGARGVFLSGEFTPMDGAEARPRIEIADVTNDGLPDVLLFGNASLKVLEQLPGPPRGHLQELGYADVGGGFSDELPPPDVLESGIWVSADETDIVDGRGLGGRRWTLHPDRRPLLEHVDSLVPAQHFGGIGDFDGDGTDDVVMRGITARGRESSLMVARSRIVHHGLGFVLPRPEGVTIHARNVTQLLGDHLYAVGEGLVVLYGDAPHGDNTLLIYEFGSSQSVSVPDAFTTDATSVISINRDNGLDKDLVLLGSQLTLLRNEDGDWAAPEPIDTGGFVPTSMAAEDVDEDGLADLIVGNATQVMWLRNILGSTFAAPERLIQQPATQLLFLPAADSTSPHVLVVTQFRVKEFARPTPNEDFQLVGTIEFSDGITGKIRSVDLDGDGDVDVLVPHADALTELANSQSGPLHRGADLISEGITEVQASDIDGDGDLDLVARLASPQVDSTSVVRTYFQRSGGFAKSRGLLCFWNPGMATQLVVGDVDFDVKADLFYNEGLNVIFTGGAD